VKRLPEPYDVNDPNEEYASSILKHARPLEPSSARKRRVWSALERSPMKRPRARASGPLIAALVLFGATAASATMPRLWRKFQVATAETELSAEAPAAAEARRSGRRRTPPAAQATPPMVPAEKPLTEADQSAPVVQPIEPAPSARVSNGPSAAKRTPPAKARPAEPVDPPASAALIVEAMRERRAGNLARARELSAEYRLKYPGGALQEEALALSIEAAAALGDDEAHRLAATYLQRYPRGRFRAQAERVIGAAR
jgi:hypothetical protein